MKHDHPISEEMLAAKAATGHSVFGPSSAHRWMICPGSLIPSLIAGDTSNKYAAEGSVAHDVAETWLKHGEPSHLIGQTREKDGFEIDITEEMLSFLEPYVDAVSEGEGDHFTEVWTDLSPYMPIPNQGGTSDHIHAHWQVLDVTDLKYGMVRVEANENLQGLCYALGAFLKYDWLYDFQTINIRIIQPRIDHDDTWTCSREELLAFGERLRVAAAAAWEPDAPRVPEPHACEYCPINQTCPAAYKATVHRVSGQFPDEEEYSLDEVAEQAENPELISEIAAPYPEMDIDALEDMLLWRPAIEKYLKAIEEYVLHKAESGVTLKKHKLVKGRAGRRKYKNNVVKRKLRRMLLSSGVEPFDLFSTKMTSPYQASRLLRTARGGTVKENEAIIDKFCTKPPGRMTLASTSDKRKRIEPAASAFED